MTPKQEIYQQTVLDAYPEVAGLALRGSENPNLMPEGSITVRMHSVGGWGAITTGKNLAMTLFDLLGYHVKANPKYGSEKKGQPTSYYLSAAPEPIRINCEYYYVDVVLSPDPNVFSHTNAVAGLNNGGVLVMQSDAKSPDEFWQSIPQRYRKIIVENNIRVYYLDAFKIARDEATDPELQLRMQGIAFQGAFFATSPLLKDHGLSETKLLDAIRDQLQHKFGSKGARVVEDNMRVVRRGFEEITEVTDKGIGDAKANGRDQLPIPVMVKREPQSASASSDIHRFWAQTGNMYATGQGESVPADPFMSMSLMPAVSSHFRDMTSIRFDHPEFIPENCTGCGDCYTVCPDTAIPGLVNEPGQVLDTVVNRLRKAGKPTEQLPRAVRQMEMKLKKLLAAAEETDPVDAIIEDAIQATLDATDLSGSDKEQLEKEFVEFREELGDDLFFIPYAPKVAISAKYRTYIGKIFKAIEEVVAAYKTLMRIEQGFRTIKSVIRIRPMYHHADHRITSHVELCVLAYLIVRHVEVATGQSWEQIARLFRPLRIVELITEAGKVYRRSELTKEQRVILKALGLRAPKEIQKVELTT